MMEVEVKEGTAPLAVDEDLPDDIEMAEDALLHTPSSGPDQGKNGSLDSPFICYGVCPSCQSVQESCRIHVMSFHPAKLDRAYYSDSFSFSLFRLWKIVNLPEI